MDGQALALLGLALCVSLCGAGSSVALWKTGTAAAGVLAEDGKKFINLFVLLYVKNLVKILQIKYVSSMVVAVTLKMHPICSLKKILTAA